MFVKQPFGRRQWLVILIATLVAAALRLYGLGEWSIWVDEAHTWRDATMPLSGEGGFLQGQRRFYPVPFLLLRFLLGMSAIGYDEWSLRLPFALAGIATVPLLAVCGRRLVGSWSAVFAACLLAINPWHIFWSQNARGYGLAMLGSVLAIYWMHRLFASGTAKDLLLAAMWVVFAGACHPTAVSLIIGFAGFLLVRHALRPSARFGLVTVLIGVLCLLGPLPWLVKYYGLFSDFQDAKGNPSLRHWVETVAFYFRPSVLMLGLLAMLLAPKSLGRDRALYLTCLVLAPMLVISSVGTQLVKVTARYAICTLPVLMLLAGFAIAEVGVRVRALPNMSEGRAWLLSAVLPALVACDYLRLDLLYYSSEQGQRARWREASQFVRDAAAERGADGIRLLTTNQPTMLYYLRQRHWFVSEADPHPDMYVESIERWRFADGVDALGNTLHEPGADNHLAWHIDNAASGERLFAVVLTMPELRESDRDSQLIAALEREMELALYLPVWVGPKDQGVYVYLPKRGD
jgi:4-amino-4-deoxy-L-arabinose transferase-like glycosyltransferase